MAITMGFDKVLTLTDEELARQWRRECARTQCGTAIIPGFNDDDFDDSVINEWWSHTYYDLALRVKRTPDTCDPLYSEQGLVFPVNVVACSTLTFEQPPEHLVRRVITMFGLGAALPNFTTDDRTDWLFPIEKGNAVEIAQRAFEQMPERRG